VPVAQADPGTAVAIDIFGEWVGGKVRADPLYDPKGERIRA
jgi:4-methylaminobutanoate oxidase (formaldehyde-forming)